ncbi:DEAD/DEAH box helicase [Methanoculleus sp. 10]|uniref:DEAD/DEAH box helicase n=1 Tax=Methanoculleus sp. 10 TaxID=430615 RepID=UPI0025F5AFA8|nr:DEAD/DEAH box helicase [Methanoculleus sp. 10]
MRYLKTTFQINDPDLAALFKATVEEHEFVKGPILEATPPFRKGCTLRHLIDEGILSPRFESLNQNLLPLDRPLYLHQERAIRRTVGEGRNLVVATGTGSGKTEIFIVTILNTLFRQQESGLLNPGVRALLLYPMNALVNDQLKRLRQLLKSCPEIIFGRYTGETREKQLDAEENYKKIHGSDPLPNERISREKMRETPPHILLTNYAMLEYLLLRPRDNVFFDGEFSRNWRFIVLDEAHTYTGAKGIEMAMLLRRLKDRVVRSEPGQLQCIATSATLGGGEEDYPAVARYAAQLCSEDFGMEDVISAEREAIPDIHGWGSPDPVVYQAWRDIFVAGRQEVQALYEAGMRHAVPQEVLDEARRRAGDNAHAFLFHVLEGDERLLWLRRHLADGPDEFDKICQQLCDGTLLDTEAIVSLVEIAGMARLRPSEASLLSARYHLFARAVEGAYLQFFPDRKLYLEPAKSVEVGGHEYPIFELGTCRYCGVPYLLGKTETIGGQTFFRQNVLPYYEDEMPDKHFLLVSSVLPESDNEDDEVEIGTRASIKGEQYILCGRCGSLDRATRVKPTCSCGDEYQILLIRISYSGTTLHKCPVCTHLSPGMPVASRFVMGRDAIPSVLATAIYQELPDRMERDRTELENQPANPWTPVKAPSVAGSGSKRNLLVFSDSRQDAAYFAPYLSQTYDKIARRSLIVQVIRENADRILKNQWRVIDCASPLLEKVRDIGLLPEYTPEERSREILRWLMYEFTSGSIQGSLEELGLCGFRLVKPDGWVPPAPLLYEPWNLSEEETWVLFQVLLDSFRKSGALRFPDGISPTEDFFQPRNFQFYFRESGSSQRDHILSWLPKSGYSNTRLDYLTRIAKRGASSISDEDCRIALKGIWQFLAPGGDSIFSGYFVQDHLGKEGVGTLMEPKRWEITSPLIEPDTQWHLCDRCKRLTLYNIRGVCPTYRCEGTLHPVDPGKLRSENHYRVLYTETKPVPMRAKEHTAQLSTEAATELQQDFLDGKVNILSCSTTFELGVDVGELEVVFMRNMPPTAANYIQRAGRAGRRTDSTAFVTTFCQRRSHDLSYFKDPMPFVKGVIRPPFFEIQNEKIVKRHLFATAIAAFWRKYPDTFRDVGGFFFNESLDVPATLHTYLREHPADLGDALQRITPAGLHTTIDLGGWGFIEDLYYEDDDHPEKGLMTKAASIVREDVRGLKEVSNELYAKGQRVDAIGYLIRTIRTRPIIDFLSTHNIIPKYGFPVDVVELQVLHTSEAARSLDLQRDLKIALSEYAPGSQVVAAGSIWESQYIKRNPQRSWITYDYVICDTCHRYHRELSELGKEFVTCEACKGDLRNSRHRGTFIIPEFGFMTGKSEPKRVSDKRPRKTYSTRAYFSGDCFAEKDLEVSLSGGVTLKAESASHGRLAIVNNGNGQHFRVCERCGYAIPGFERIPNSHQTAFGKNCNGSFRSYDLGHEYLTDILKLEFVGYSNTHQNFWLSLLYALLDGLSTSLGVNRDDLDGVLYPGRDKLNEPALILFDSVPGGAGHVKRAIEQEEALRSVLKAAYRKMKACTCGAEQGHASCYGCLRNYQNQFCHEKLDRRIVIDFFEGLGLDA